MTKKYSREPPQPKKACKTQGRDLRVHFKNTYNVARNVKGMFIKKAVKYLNDVLAHKRCVPFRRFKGCLGRTP